MCLTAISRKSVSSNMPPHFVWLSLGVFSRIIHRELLICCPQNYIGYIVCLKWEKHPNSNSSSHSVPGPPIVLDSLFSDPKRPEERTAKHGFITLEAAELQYKLEIWQLRLLCGLHSNYIGNENGGLWCDLMINNLETEEIKWFYAVFICMTIWV